MCLRASFNRCTPRKAAAFLFHICYVAGFFDVLPSKTLFIVDTHAGSMRVLGTQWDVRLQERSGVVALQSAAKASRSQRWLNPGDRRHPACRGLLPRPALTLRMRWRGTVVALFSLVRDWEM
jgi:ferric-dicitrate binding protein FerR (iron transport regulator)